MRQSIDVSLCLQLQLPRGRSAFRQPSQRTTPRSTVLLGRLGFAFASAIPFTLLRMFTLIQDRRRPALVYSRPCYPVFRAPPSCSSLSRHGSLLAQPPAPSRQTSSMAPFIASLVCTFLLSFVLALYTLWKTTRAASGLRKLQLRYLLLGVPPRRLRSHHNESPHPPHCRHLPLQRARPLLLPAGRLVLRSRHHPVPFDGHSRRLQNRVSSTFAPSPLGLRLHSLRRIAETRHRLRQRQHSPSSSSLSCGHPCDLLPTPKSLASSVTQSLRVPRNLRLPSNHSRC